MIEGLRSHLWLLALLVGLSNGIEARVGRCRPYINRLRFIQGLPHPDKFLQVKLEGVVAGGKAEKSSCVHGTYGQSIGFFYVIELIHRDHSARARLIDNEYCRFSRNMFFDILGDEA